MIYHHKIQIIPPKSTGDGTKSNPWYWYQKTSGNSMSLNNENTSGDNRRLYLRVKLLAGTTYNIGQTSPGGQDGKIWLYDQNGSQLTCDDDNGYTITGVYCSDAFSYTPSTTGIYIIGAGSYSQGAGNYTLAMDPLPQEDPLPVQEITYDRSTGFNQFGKPIKYRTAELAGLNLIPKNGLIFYASLNGKNPNIAKTGQSLITLGNVTYQKINNIPCAYFSGNGTCLYINQALNQTFPMLSSYNSITYCAWFYTQDKSKGQEIISCTDNGGFSIGINSDGNNGYVHVYLMAGNSYLNSNVCSINRIFQNQWMFICVVYNGSKVYVYLNNDKVFEENKTGYLNYPSNAPFVIGAESENFNINQASDDCFKGYISSVRVYNKALSNQEILTLSKEFRIN